MIKTNLASSDKFWAAAGVIRKLGANYFFLKTEVPTCTLLLLLLVTLTGGGLVVGKKDDKDDWRWEEWACL